MTDDNNLKEQVDEITTKYVAAFSRVVEYVLKKLDRAKDDTREYDQYNEILKDAVRIEWPESYQRMENIAHWILHDNDLIDYDDLRRRNGDDVSAVRKNYDGSLKSLAEVITPTVKKYLATTVARVEGSQRADEVGDLLKKLLGEK